MSAGTARAATAGSKLRVRQHALVTVGPADVQGAIELLDVAGPRRRRGRLGRTGAPATRARRAQMLEWIDRAVTVGPVHPERIASHQVDVLGPVRIALAEDRDGQLLHESPPTRRP